MANRIPDVKDTKQKVPTSVGPKVKCPSCSRYEDDGGPLCMKMFCPGGN
ncbi:hypothetical protein VPHD148_0078 [Vibrio phage D148]